jgi:DNA-binding transcriptional regulator GbsR (MarR family)
MEKLGKTWWAVRRYGDMPEPVTVTKSTTNRVWVVEKRIDGVAVERCVSRSSEHHEYFEAEADAVEFLRKRLNRDIEYHKKVLNDARSRLGELESKYGKP